MSVVNAGRGTSQQEQSRGGKLQTAVSFYAPVPSPVRPCRRNLTMLPLQCKTSSFILILSHLTRVPRARVSIPHYSVLRRGTVHVFYSVNTCPHSFSHLTLNSFPPYSCIDCQRQSTPTQLQNAPKTLSLLVQHLCQWLKHSLLNATTCLLPPTSPCTSPNNDHEASCSSPCCRIPYNPSPLLRCAPHPRGFLPI